jgi:hypothetical protein
MLATRFSVFALVSASAFNTACAGEDSGVPETGAAQGDITIAAPEFSVPTGESFQCFYSDIITDRELSVATASAVQASGGHHVTLYYVDNQRPVGMSPCSGTTEMEDWHFVVGAGGEGNAGDLVDLAPGLAIRIPAGKQLMIQLHYINIMGEEYPARDTMSVYFADPAKVVAYASDFVINDEKFRIEPGQKLVSTMDCVIPQDVQLSMFLGHMHEHGVQYTLEKIDEAGNVIESMYDEKWAPSFASHPPIDKFSVEAPLKLAKGTRLRQRCEWNNTSTSPLLFPTEMCVGFGYYFPGDARLMCERVSGDEEAAEGAP